MVLKGTGLKIESNKRHKKDKVTKNLLKSKIGKLWYSDINKIKNKGIYIHLKAKFKEQIMGQMFYEY